MEFVLAALFAVVAGFGTSFSPCVLPVLPLVLGGAASGGSRRPLGIAIGLGASFAFVTLAFAYVLAALGLPDTLLRTVAIVSLLVFGVVLLVPWLSARFEALLSRVVKGRAVGVGGDGFLSGVFLGASLGVLYVPCAGPVLAAVLTVSASQELGAQRLLTGLLYAVGTAVGVFILLKVGRRALTRLRANAGRFSMAMGAVMIAFAVLTLANVDATFRRAVATSLPGWLVSPTAGLEEAIAADPPVSSGLQNAGPAPEIVGTQEWFNSEPLTLRELRGRVVLIDFWTYTCINCIRTQPYLKAWDAEYRDDGLTIIGVHTPEFAFERDADNVERAVREAGLEFPIAQDNEFATWNNYQNQYWPAKYLIDAKGDLRYAHFGEGDYEETEAAIRGLLVEAGREEPDAVSPVPADSVDPGTQTPETYIGFARAEGFIERVTPGERDYGPLPGSVPFNAFALGGRWRIGEEEGEAVADAQIRARFAASKVFLVMGGKGNVRVNLDGKVIKTVRVNEQDIYPLVDLPRARSGLLTLDFDRGVQAFAFTFG